MAWVQKAEGWVWKGDVLRWLRRDKKAQWSVLIFLVLLLVGFVWYVVSCFQGEEAPRKTSYSPRTETRISLPTNSNPSRAYYPTFSATPSTPPPSVIAPATRSSSDFPPDRVVMRDMTPSVWDPSKRYFVDTRTREYFITPPNVFVFNNGLMLWSQPFEDFANTYHEQGRIFRAQAVSAPPLYVNWRSIIEKYGERARPPQN